MQNEINPLAFEDLSWLWFDLCRS